jgi:hypothetical protein
MRKLHLDVEALQVASFATSSPDPARGTVLGQDGAVHQALLDLAVTDASACSWTNGVVACKTAGPCCQTL